MSSEKSHEEDRIDTFMEMGKIIEEELDYKLVGFDPGFSFRSQDWSESVQLPFEFARMLVYKLITLRVSREVLDEVEKKAYPRPTIPNVIRSVEERVNAKIS